MNDWSKYPEQMLKQRRLFDLLTKYTNDMEDNNEESKSHNSLFQEFLDSLNSNKSIGQFNVDVTIDVAGIDDKYKAILEPKLRVLTDEFEDAVGQLIHDETCEKCKAEKTDLKEQPEFISDEESVITTDETKKELNTLRTNAKEWWAKLSVTVKKYIREKYKPTWKIDTFNDSIKAITDAYIFEGNDKPLEPKSIRNEAVEWYGNLDPAVMKFLNIKHKPDWNLKMIAGNTNMIERIYRAERNITDKQS